MQYVTNAERFGEQRGIQIGEQRGIQIGLLQNAREDIVEVLVARFGKESNKVQSSITEIADSDHLKKLLIKAATVQSWNEFLQLIETKH